MSIHVMNLVWKNAPCQGNTLLALLALADWSDDEGKSWPSVVTLAKKSRQSERNCHTVIRELESLKLIEIKRREGTSNMFVINLELLGGVQSLQGAKISKRGGKRLKSLQGTAEMFAPYTSIETSQDQNHTSTSDFSETESSEPKQTKSKPKTKNPTTDSRHAVVFTSIFERYRQANGTTPETGRLAKNLSTWLRNHTDWLEEEILACVRNRFLSDVNNSQEPYIWVEGLASYKSGPLDKFGKPKGKTNVRTAEEQRITENRRAIAFGLREGGRSNAGHDGPDVPGYDHSGAYGLLEEGIDRVESDTD